LSPIFGQQKLDSKDQNLCLEFIDFFQSTQFTVSKKSFAKKRCEMSVALRKAKIF